MACAARPAAAGGVCGVRPPAGRRGARHRVRALLGPTAHASRPRAAPAADIRRPGASAGGANCSRRSCARSGPCVGFTGERGTTSCTRSSTTDGPRRRTAWRRAWPVSTGPSDVVAERAAVIPVPLARRAVPRTRVQPERAAGPRARRALVGGRSGPTRSRARVATATQTQLTPEQRPANVSGAFTCRQTARVALRRSHVVLVDDVVTTAATLNACAAALHAAGARASSATSRSAGRRAIGRPVNPTRRSTMAIRVGINGFGRIGRQVLRAARQQGVTDFDFVAVNDLTDTQTLAHLFKYDSVHGTYDGDVSRRRTDDHRVDGDADQGARREGSRRTLPWKELGVDIVLESTGRFTKAEDARKHIAGGARKVVISAPAKGEDITIVLGVNHDKYDAAKHHIISNASCTTNCLVPMVKVIRDTFGFVHGIDGHDPQLHQRPEHPRPAAQGPAPRARRGGVDHPDDDRRGQGHGARDSRGEGQDRRHRDSRADARRVAHRARRSRSRSATTMRSRERRVQGGRARAPLKGILAYTEEELVSLRLHRQSALVHPRRQEHQRHRRRRW